jgi:hypothetical protein
METKQQILIIGVVLFILLLAVEGTGTMANITNPPEGVMKISQTVTPGDSVIPAVPQGTIVPNSVIVVVKDMHTRENLDGALVYFDGGYLGDTSSPDEIGIVVIHDVGPGIHTVRVTRPGYNENTTKIDYPAEKAVGVLISKGALVSLNPDGPSPNAINVVFYPSSTSYSCTDNQNVSAPEYVTNETRFREDVRNVINNTYLNLDQFTSPSDPLPDNYQNYFNFYYYYDSSSPADAFSGCSGSVPEGYWDNVTFSDVTVILYPAYYGRFTTMACQPTGCTQIFGPGRSQMKAPADQEPIVRLETGHAVFGLDDTFCGSTYYWQNEPYPNVWSSLESCQSDAQSHDRDPAQCRRIMSDDSIPICIRNFWHWDPMPDVMAGADNGTFGSAATQRINYILSQAGPGVQAPSGTGVLSQSGGG